MIYIFRRYEITSQKKPLHQSSTCVVHLAYDHEDDSRVVALKFMKQRDHFVRELRVRAKGLFHSDFVVSIMNLFSGWNIEFMNRIALNVSLISYSTFLSYSLSLFIFIFLFHSLPQPLSFSLFLSLDIFVTFSLSLPPFVLVFLSFIPHTILPSPFQFYTCLPLFLNSSLPFPLLFFHLSHSLLSFPSLFPFFVSSPLSFSFILFT